MLADGIPAPVPQQGEATYAEKLDPGELQLDWTKSAVELHRTVRVGGAWTTLHGRRLKVWRTRLAEGDALEPGEIDAASLRVGTGDGPKLDIALDPALAPGTRALLREGCDHTLATCAARFGNAVNFQGEPFLPGNDLLARYPTSYS